MKKEEILEILTEGLIREQKKNNNLLFNIQKEKNEAPGAMQSHSDTTRFQLEKTIADISARKTKIEKVIDFLRKGSVPVLSLRENGDIFYAILLPRNFDFFFSEKVDKTQLQVISEKTPLGAALTNASPGTTIEIKTPTKTRTLELLK